jgi:hypothetical protein
MSESNCNCLQSNCTVCQEKLTENFSQSVTLSTPTILSNTVPSISDQQRLSVLSQLAKRPYVPASSPAPAPINVINVDIVPSTTAVTSTTNTSINNDVHILNDNSCGVNFVPGTNFRFLNQRALFTYKSHLPKEEFKNWFTASVNGVKQIEIAHEVGKKTGIDYPHSHVLVDFGRGFQTTNVRRFDFTLNNEIIHPHIKKVTNKTHWDRCCNYLAKEDPECSHLKKEINIVEATWNAETKTDALRSLCKKPSDVGGISQLYDMKPSAKLDLLKPDRPWSLNLLNYLESNPPDDRHIIWVYDQFGESGKTKLVKYLCNEFPLKYHFSRGAASNKDTSFQITTALKSGWNQHCFFFDFPRDMENKNFYESLENIKDGMITSSKYLSHSAIFNSPHIVVMANFPPNISKLSKDRWRIFEITSNYNWLAVDFNRLDALYKAHLEKLQQEKLDKSINPVSVLTIVPPSLPPVPSPEIISSINLDYPSSTSYTTSTLSNSYILH